MLTPVSHETTNTAGGVHFEMARDLKADAAAISCSRGQAASFLHFARGSGRCVSDAEDTRVGPNGVPGSLPNGFSARWSSPVARQAHNLKVESSNLSRATNRGERPVLTRDGEAYREETCSPLLAAPLTVGGCRVARGLEGRARDFTESRSADFSRVERRDTTIERDASTPAPSERIAVSPAAVNLPRLGLTDLCGHDVRTVGCASATAVRSAALRPGHIFVSEPAQAGEARSAGARQLDEGDRCPVPGCDGAMSFRRDGECRCHVVAPCSACERSHLACGVCGAEEFPC